jgi:flagellin-like protein
MVTRAENETMQIKQQLEEFVTGDERGVSPVIGVILMVAITVILAAVIGTFVLGLGDSVQQNVQAGASVQANPSSGGSAGDVVVTFNSNQNAANLEVDASAVSGTGSIASSSTTFTTLSDVGDSVRITENSAADDTEIQIVVTAVGEDGTRTVIVDRTVQV